MAVGVFLWFIVRYIESYGLIPFSYIRKGRKEPHKSLLQTYLPRLVYYFQLRLMEGRGTALHPSGPLYLSKSVGQKKESLSVK